MACSPDWKTFLRLRFVPFPWFCFGSSGRRNTRGGRNRGCEIGLRQAERPSPPVCSVSVVLFRLFGSAGTRGGRNRGCEIGVVKSGFGRQSVLRLRFIPFPWFCSGSSGRRNTRGVRNRGCEIGLRNQAVKSSCEIKLRLDRFSHASDWFRFRGSVSALQVGGTLGSAEHAGRSKSGCEIGLRNQASVGQIFSRLRFVPFPWFCSGSSCRRNTRVGGTRGAVKIELRNQASA